MRISVPAQKGWIIDGYVENRVKKCPCRMSRSCEEKIALMKSKQTSKARVHQKSTASWQRGTPGFVSSYENATVLRLSRENNLTNVPQRSSGSPPPPQHSVIVRGCLHAYILVHDDVKVTPPQKLQP